MACPKKVINWKEVDEKLEAGSSGTEVASALGMHPDTLYLRCVKEKEMGFSEYSQIKRACGDVRLRNAQFKSAMDGNITMQIWLGKVRLKQKEPTNDSNIKESLSELSAFFKVQQEKYKNENEKIMTSACDNEVR